MDVLEAEREEETKMVNEKVCFRLFGVDLSTKIREEEEEARKKMKNDGSFGKTTETSHHPKRKGMVSYFFLFLLFQKIFVGFLVRFLVRMLFVLFLFSVVLPSISENLCWVFSKDFVSFFFCSP